MYSYPFAIWGITGWFQFSSDRWVLQFFSGKSAVGVYAAIYQIANIPAVLLNSSLSQFFVPIIFEKAGDVSDFKRFKNSLYLLNLNFTLFLIIGAVLLFVFLFFHCEIINLITTKDFSTHSNLLPLVYAGILLFNLAQIITLIGHILKKVNKYLPFHIMNGIIAVGLNIILGYFYSLKGIALAMIFKNIFYICWAIILGLKLLKDVSETK